MQKATTIKQEKINEFTIFWTIRHRTLWPVFDNTSECYKFFWFKAILSKISEGKTEYTYEELVDEMIAEAWYMVSEYHLNLGPRDNLEQTVKRMNEITNLKSAEKKSNILEYLKIVRIKK